MPRTARQLNHPIPGTRTAPLPPFVAPELATLVASVPEEPGWVHELKLDGYRLLCRIDANDVRLITRAGNDWTGKFPEFVEPLRQLGATTALIDAEAVVLDEHGRSRFQALQRVMGNLGGRERARLALYAFDLLHLDGLDLRGAELVARKAALQGLMAGAPFPLHYNSHVDDHAREFFAAACKAGVEGVVSKRASSPYQSGRTRSWLKIKCSRRQEFVIVGFSDPEGSRVGLGALLLGAHDAEGVLRYTGKVGTGFSGRVLVDLRKRLAPLERKTPPVTNAPRGRGIHWVAPKLVAEVSFTEWTGDGRIRHPSFQGLREDKRADDVSMEVEQPVATLVRPAGNAPTGSAPPRSRPAIVAGVRLSHPDRVYFPDIKLTKWELAEYYASVAPRALPPMVNRPLTLVRCPEGIDGPCFYQKRARDSIPRHAPRVKVKEGRLPYTMVTDLKSLIGLVQVGVIEFHVWGSRADKLERPDMMILDLDPGPGVPWSRIVDLAFAVKEWLEQSKLVCFVKGTGGKGVHVVVPLVRRSTWEQVKSFANVAALEMVRRWPGEVTAKMAKSGRQGKIFVDYLRNDPESTSIASYSVRKRPGAPTAQPMFWEELKESSGPLMLGPREAVLRMNQPDPWEGFEAARRPLLRR